MEKITVDAAPGEKREENRSKRENKKRELALHTIRTLAQRGFANTSLRDIAEESGVSVGVLHYYFEDKVDLISYCVQIYKEGFIERLDNVLHTADTEELVLSETIDRLADAVMNDGELHRLWYDIRSQAMFDSNFSKVVDELEEALAAHSARFLIRVNYTHIDPKEYYLSVDGRFRYYLQRSLAGDRNAHENLKQSLYTLFEAYKKL